MSQKMDYSKIERFAKEIRYYTLKELNHMGFGHYGGSLSIIELLACLYFSEMNITPENFDEKERDHFILSKGHAGPALYATLFLKGFFDESWLYTLNGNGTRLPSHPDRNLTPGVDMTTGSLGQGIGAAAGIAYGQQHLFKNDYYTYCVVGDGELNEGQVWEAAQFASHNKLSRLVVFVDDNKKQLDGTTKEISDPGNIANKFSAFGFQTATVNGTRIDKIMEKLHELKQSNCEQPIALVLDTVKGQGVPYIENIELNHHLRLDEEALTILEEFTQELGNELESGSYE